MPWTGRAGLVAAVQTVFVIAMKEQCLGLLPLLHQDLVRDLHLNLGCSLGAAGIRSIWPAA
jgi:hypothetical protein